MGENVKTSHFTKHRQSIVDFMIITAIYPLKPLLMSSSVSHNVGIQGLYADFISLDLNQNSQHLYNRVDLWV